MAKPRVIYHQADDFQQQIDEPVVPSTMQLKARRHRPWLWYTLLGLSVLILVETAFWIYSSWQQAPLLGGAWLVVFTSLVVLIGRLIGREWWQLRTLKRQWRQRSTWQHSANSFDARACIKNMGRSDLLVLWQAEHVNHLTKAEQLQSFERDVLSKVDQHVADVISRHATDTALIVAASPFALLDVAAMLWRNQRLISAIAEAYGIPLGYWSRITLWRQILMNLAYASASELAIDSGSQLLGTELLGKLSARLAQGVGAGLVTARLGIQAQQLCRPLAFVEQQPLRIRDIRPKLLARVKALFPTTTGVQSATAEPLASPQNEQVEN